MAINKSYWQHQGIIPATLKEKEKHLRYEIIDMLRNTCRSFCNWNVLSLFEKNLLVESLAVHARILVDFFYFGRGNINDVIAQDFMPRGKNWKKIRPKITQVLYDAKEKANKQLAHLSTWRVKIEKDGKKPWDYNNICVDIENVIAVFSSVVGKKF